MLQCNAASSLSPRDSNFQYKEQIEPWFKIQEP